MNIYDLMDALCDVSDYFVVESKKDSREIRERIRIRWAATAACACLAAVVTVLAIFMRGGVDPTPPADSVTETGRTETADTDGTHEAEPGYETVEHEGIIYAVYSDHAEVIGSDPTWVSNYSVVYIRETVSGVPVTAIADDFAESKFDLDQELWSLSWEVLWHQTVYVSSDDPVRRIGASAGTLIAELAREYAISHDLIFVEVDSLETPDHYYPETVTKLDWKLRDTSGDKYIAVDDNDEITALVEKYRSTGEGYDELLKRVVYRYVCAAEIGKYSPMWICDPVDEDVNLYNTDYDRHWYYYTYYHSGSDTYYLEYDERFAYGDIDTFEEFTDYVGLLYTEYQATIFEDSHINGVYRPYKNAGGDIFHGPRGTGYGDTERNPTYRIFYVSSDTIRLMEIREKWTSSNDEDAEYAFTGKYTYRRYTLEKHDGKWQIADWHYDVFFPYRAEGYEALIGE